MAQPIEDDEFDSIAQAQAVEDDEFEQLAKEQGGGPTVSEERTGFQAPAPEVSQEAPGFFSGWDEPQTWKDAGRAVYNGLQFGVGAPIAGLEAARAELLHEIFGGEIPAGKSGLQHLLDTYRQGRDAKVAEDEEAQARSPKASLAGSVVGGAIPAVASGGASLSGGIGAAALRGAGAGALEGAVAGAGTSKSDLTRGEVGGVAKDALLGGVAGGVTGGVAGGAGKGLEKLPDAVRKFAQRQALRATGLTSKDAQLVDARHGREALDTLGDRALALIRAGDTPEEIARKAAESASTSGGAVSRAVSELDALRTPAHGPLPAQVAQGIRTTADRYRLQPAARGVRGQLVGLADDFDALPAQAGLPDGSPLSFGDWWESRQALDDSLQRGFNRNPNASAPPLSEELMQRVRALQEAEMERAAQGVSGEVAERYGTAKGAYRQDATLAHAAEARRNRLAGAPFDAADEARNDFGRDALVSLAAPQTGARRLLEGLVDPVRASPGLARAAASAPVRFGAAAAGMAGTVAEPLASSATRAMVQRVVSQKPSTEEKVEAYLQLAPEELGQYADGLRSALEKNGRRGLAVYFWAKSGSDPQFQRLLKGIQDGSLGGESSQ